MSDKREAIAHVNSYLGNNLLDEENTHFSNVNKTVPVWWLDIPVRKIGKQLHFLLRREDGGLIWLRCPPGTLDSNAFRRRLDTDKVSLELETGTHFLRDRHSGYNFSRNVEREFRISNFNQHSYGVDRRAAGSRPQATGHHFDTDQG